jgi:hypothetical protein
MRSLCRGCGAVLEKLPSGLWADENGITVCVRLSCDGIAIPSKYVLHVPMPEGLRGAPGTI